MTNDSLAGALEKLRAATRQTGEGSVREIDAALQGVSGKQDVRSIGPLLMLLDDDAAYDEAMFSLIHAAEAFDDDAYVRALLDVLSELWATAPRWASIVFMRALNNNKTRDQLVIALREATPQARYAARLLCEKIVGKSEKFLSKTMPVLAAIEA